LFAITGTTEAAPLPLSNWIASFVEDGVDLEHEYPMRRLLYITPYFPPQTKVGALRPLKFVRHLHGYGWEAVVLCDLKKGDTVDQLLLDAVPERTEVHCTYSIAGPKNRARAFAPRATSDSPPKSAKKSAFSQLPEKLGWSPEFVPLGAHRLDMPAAKRAGRVLLKARKFDAIMVNADPYASMLVGDALGQEFGLPVIQDLRDPWSVCDLRRQSRPGPQRRWVDKTERGLVERCRAMVLNSEATVAAYRDHYSDLDPSRFACIRNHGDAELIAGAQDRIAASSLSGAEGPFQVLFLGNFRRFLQGDALMQAFALLKERGKGADDLVLLVTGKITDEARELAASIGVADMLVDADFIPYTRIGPAMANADLLVALSNASRMRIPAKFYDYATSSRPILVVADPAHDELRRMTESLDGAAFADIGSPSEIAASIAEVMTAGSRVFDRSSAGLDSRSATARLAAVLDRVAGQSA
jgi:glycosyltransferase involved in cell wall biosynthesis